MNTDAENSKMLAKIHTSIFSLLSLGQICCRGSGRLRKKFIPADWCCLLHLSGCYRCAEPLPELGCSAAMPPDRCSEKACEEACFLSPLLHDQSLLRLLWSYLLQITSYASPLVFLYWIATDVNSFVNQCHWSVLLHTHPTLGKNEWEKSKTCFSILHWGC